ncbi:hypothetical protein HWV62_14454 [Athelia sp. TMB]|nr:hypothetical protein HWV62_14454 [Athelia sp. TMB]
MSDSDLAQPGPEMNEKPFEAPPTFEMPAGLPVEWSITIANQYYSEIHRKLINFGHGGEPYRDEGVKGVLDVCHLRGMCKATPRASADAEPTYMIPVVIGGQAYEIPSAVHTCTEYLHAASIEPGATFATRCPLRIHELHKALTEYSGIGAGYSLRGESRANVLAVLQIILRGLRVAPFDQAIVRPFYDWCVSPTLSRYLGSHECTFGIKIYHHDPPDTAEIEKKQIKVAALLLHLMPPVQFGLFAFLMDFLVGLGDEAGGLVRAEAIKMVEMEVVGRSCDKQTAERIVEWLFERRWAAIRKFAFAHTESEYERLVLHSMNDWAAGNPTMPYPSRPCLSINHSTGCTVPCGLRAPPPTPKGAGFLQNIWLRFQPRPPPPREPRTDEEKKELEELEREVKRLQHLQELTAPKVFNLACQIDIAVEELTRESFGMEKEVVAELAELEQRRIQNLQKEKRHLEAEGSYGLVQAALASEIVDYISTTHAESRGDHTRGMGRITSCETCGSYITDDVSIPKSPAPHLWRTSQTPSPPERKLISQYVSDGQSTVSQIEGHVHVMLRKVAALLQKRDKLMRSVARHESFLAPVRLLPEEILANIFLLSLPTTHDRSSFSFKRAPLLFTQVSVAWRTCALSSQRLWSSFTLSSQLPTHASLAEAWLSRTKSSPLSIRMDVARDSSKCALWPAVAQVVQYCDRWRELDIEAPTSILCRMTPVRHRLCLLEKLTIDIIHDCEEHIKNFDYAPRLRWVKIKAAVHPLMLLLPWGQLDNLEIVVYRLAPLLAILELSSNIKHLALENSPKYLDAFPCTRQTVTLRHVASLRICILQDSMSLFTKIRCPNLTSLKIQTSAASLMSVEFQALLASSPSLAHLSIQYNKIFGPTVDLVPCLTAVPWLSSLEIDMRGAPWLSEEMVVAMTHAADSGCLLQGLEELTVLGPQLDACLLADMIISRYNPGDPNKPSLKRVNAGFQDDTELKNYLNKEQARTLIRAIDNGMPELITSYNGIYFGQF